jgi:GT2 family glycosyltransferase
MDVSIIIVNYNTRNLLKQCIDSVFEKTHSIKFEIIVVDNASSDGSQQMIKENFLNIILIESQENLGFGRANNIGFKYANGRNIFLLNSDTILLNNAVKILSDFLDANLNVGVCGGNLFDVNLKPNHSYRRTFPSILWELNWLTFGYLEKIRYGKNREFNYTNDVLEVGYIIGADMMVRMTVLDEVGVFDADFFMYSEESELSWRIKEAGYKIMSVPQAQIIHFEGGSFQRKNINNNKLKLYFEGRELYYIKTTSKTRHFIVNTVYMSFLILKFIFYFFNQKKHQANREAIQIFKSVERKFRHFDTKKISVLIKV